jgi:hypothetical protein
MQGMLDSYNGPTDQEGPTVSNFDPPLGTVIERTDPIQFDVTDISGIASVFVVSWYADGTSECVWDGNSFAPRFLIGSSRVAITDGYRFVIRRTGGWLNTPISLSVRAVDSAGNVGSGVFE